MKTYKFTFPFTGQVKTQLRIVRGKDGKRPYLMKPANVKQFENAVRSVLAVAFPFEHRPLQGYLRFDMVHYTTFRRNPEGAIEPTKKGDLDNLFKTLADCFEPIYKKILLYDEDGNPLLTEKGSKRYKKEIVSPGVIQNDKYIMRAGLHWVPVHNEEDERIEVFVTSLEEDMLFSPPSFSFSEVIEFE